MRTQHNVGNFGRIAPRSFLWLTSASADRDSTVLLPEEEANCCVLHISYNAGAFLCISHDVRILVLLS